MSNQAGLPDYAEAAPDVFLELIEGDLEAEEPVIYGLLKPAAFSPFGGCLRPGLLWALESLAWDQPDRVSHILAQLSGVPIDDNYANTPINSLQGIFRHWLPCTSVSLSERIRILRRLCKKYPDIGWQICIAQLSTGPESAFPNHRPRWREDAATASNLVTNQQSRDFQLKALKLVLDWPVHDHRTLGDLVVLRSNLTDDDQTRIWNLIDAWAETDADDSDKANLRDRIRRYALARQSGRNECDVEFRDRAHEAYERLEPVDPVLRHAWLFNGSWVEPWADELRNEDLDYEKHEERIRDLRTEAVGQIWGDFGFDGVIRLLSGNGAPSSVGEALARATTEDDARVELLGRLMQEEGVAQPNAEMCLRGFFWSLDPDDRSPVISAATEGMDNDTIVRLFRCAPFDRHAWCLLGDYDPEVRQLYWQTVEPGWVRNNTKEVSEALERLLDANRPHTAFNTVRFNWESVETSLLKRLLLRVADEKGEPGTIIQLASHNISKAFGVLAGRTGIDWTEMALLEFKFIQALDHSEHGIPNLEKMMAESPPAFVQVLAMIFGRDDAGEDPPEWEVFASANRAALGSAAHRLLRNLRRIPGTGPDGKINENRLSEWIAETRGLCTQHGRALIGDHYIGQMLARGPACDHGIKPCIEVSKAMEKFKDQEIELGFVTGMLNERGVYSRSIGEGGIKERALASRFRDWARTRSAEYPFVARTLNKVAGSYDRDAQLHDQDAELERRRTH